MIHQAKSKGNGKARKCQIHSGDNVCHFSYLHSFASPLKLSCGCDSSKHPLKLIKASSEHSLKHKSKWTHSQPSKAQSHLKDKTDMFEKVITISRL